MCNIFKVSKSGFYHWLKATPSKRWLENVKFRELIHQIFMDSSQSYGAPRIRAELLELGHKISKRRVANIMKVNGWFAKRKRKFKVTTDSKHNYPIAPNLLGRKFDVEQPNKVWVSDMTYIATKKGWMYLTVIIDLYHRKVIGWSMSKDLTTENTIMKAWQMAILNNPISRKLIFHSDRGVQYASQEFRKELKKYKLLVSQSMSRKGNFWDNAVAESFFKSLKVELVYHEKYNTKRRHSTLGDKNITEIELELLKHKIAA